MAVVSRDLRSRATEGARTPASFNAGMFVWVLFMIMLVLVAQWGWQRGTTIWDGFVYGTPRTTQLSAVIAAGDSEVAPTQFIARNMDGNIDIIVLPSNTAEQILRLPAPYLVGADRSQVVPHMHLADADGDGTDDLLVSLRGEMLIYLHKGQEWRLPLPEERISLQP